MSQYKKGSALVVIIIVFAAAILGLVGYIIWQNFFNQPTTPKDTAVTSDEQVIKRPAVKTYKGSGYTTEYVDTWTVDAAENPDGPIVKFISPDYKAAMEVGAEKGATVTLSITPATGDIQEYVKDFLTQVGKSPESYGQVDIAGQTGYEFNYIGEGADFYHTIFNYKENNYLFVYQPAPDQAETYRVAANIIIDGFKFD